MAPTTTNNITATTLGKEKTISEEYVVMAPTTTTKLTPTTLAKEKTINEEYVVHESDRPKVGYKEFSDDIPVISAAGIDEDYPGGRREEIRKKVVEACEKWGIFQLVDHGVDQELFTQAFELGRQFFDLPDEYKHSYPMLPGTMGGYLVSSHLKDEIVANWRELMVFVEQPIHARNYSLWPDKPEGWRAVIEEYGVKLMEVARKIFELLSESMGLEKDALINSLCELQQLMLVNHYPICPQPDRVIGLRRHTDPSCMTILAQDEVGGLQCTIDDGNTWATVRPIKNALVINIGEFTHFLSNGRYTAADHQVVVNGEQTRKSISMFFNPALDAKVYPLKVNEGETSILQEPIPFLQMMQKHDEIYTNRIKIKKLATEQNWSQEEFDCKLAEVEMEPIA